MKDKTVLLIADDNPGHAELLEINLRKFGVSNPVLQFPDGISVLNYISSHRDHFAGPKEMPFILMLDICMPGINGREVLIKLKNDELLKTIPVFIVTTSTDPGELQACKESGCAGCFIKPVDYARLAGEIKDLLLGEK